MTLQHPTLALALWLALTGSALATPGGFDLPIDPDQLPIALPTPGPSPTPTLGGTPAGEPLSGLRLSATADVARLEIDLPHATAIQERATPGAWRLSLTGVSARDLPAGTDPVLGGLQARNDADGLTLELPWKYWCPTEVQTPSANHLVITFKKTYVQLDREAIARGVEHQHRRSADALGPLDVHVLRVDPRVPGVRLVPGIAGGASFRSREPVSAIARRYGAIAGVNGSYFSMRTGEPLGLLMVDRELVSAPLFNRTALAIGAHGAVFIGNTQLSYRVALPTGETYDLDGVNQARGLNRMVLYTGRFGASTGTPLGGHEFALGPDGTVLAEGANDLAIPPGGFVVSAQGQPADWLANGLKLGSRLAITTPLADYWPGVMHAVGGGPTLLRGGAIAVDAEAEQFKPDIAQGAAPRTAVGLTPAGEVLIVTVDGRHPSLSRGLSLEGLAALMRELGASEAMNFDGGGSTAMAIGAAVVNHPSDGSERPVNNALLVFGDALPSPAAAAR